MIQSLNLLQMERLELQQLIQLELMANPMLEEVEPDGDLPEERPSDDKIESNDVEAERKEQEQNWDEYLKDAYEPYTQELAPESGTEETTYERVPRVESSLQEQLLTQLRLEINDPQALRIGEEIIGEISADGYLATACHELAERLNVEEHQVGQVLAKIQEFDPSGVGARDLRECLLIQLRRLELDDVLAYEVVDKCFPELSRRLVAEIAKKLGLSARPDGLKEVHIALKLIAELDPKPGLSAEPSHPRYITPDLFVTQIGDEFFVTLNEHDMPRIRINDEYAHFLTKDARQIDKNGKEFLNEKLGSARWLIRAIGQRRRTMVKVMRSIIKHQKEFFRHGVQQLKPLTLRDIAADVEVHESTVSRVTNNKYVQTARGIFELRYFFDSRIDTDSGEDASAASVMDVIRKLIENENPKKPLSDQQLEKALVKQGIAIARRTVAKYRDALKILPARFRKHL